MGWWEVVTDYFTNSNSPHQWPQLFNNLLKFCGNFHSDIQLTKTDRMAVVVICSFITGKFLFATWYPSTTLSFTTIVWYHTSIIIDAKHQYHNSCIIKWHTVLSLMTITEWPSGNYLCSCYQTCTHILLSIIQVCAINYELRVL